MKYLDAHNHLHDARLAPHRAAILEQLAQLPIDRAVVNGTREEDWESVTALAREQSFVVPSFGLHPWYVASRTSQWLERLRGQLEAHPNAGVGEIGLDRWIEGHDPKVQAEVFLPQLALAAELNRPVTIHCLQAWGALDELLRAHPLPRRGFLIHAYGGPQEMVAGFARLGAYFSFNAYFLHERKSRQREVFRHIPEDRLLIETDAPDMHPPEKFTAFPLRDGDDKPINHPANIAITYRHLAEIREVSPESLASSVATNFARLFGN
ncbi:TatD-related deoxyribonuclease [Chthoniobacter flavus Ellin428]|uniref:TatD-related deoxyribonuclease n=1 Tax=Chthoniobacter flavus Ellin428 TaxID=497964 RepID=B4CY21_9BACT|nr:TatD family hydrolase [Chthoniobacter flavus]EDY21169.1 TatD-related deoxyribonuclease [Chthoniobacter flavus Ellin428]TCO87541.1 TatD DNase family protein [Chthoniobacter flavus]